MYFSFFGFFEGVCVFWVFVGGVWVFGELALVFRMSVDFVVGFFNL
jgi:hypothetical protein